MRFNNNYIIILFLSFLLLIFTFYYFYKFNISNFIGNLNKYIYIYSSIICIIGFCITFYYILIKNDFNESTTINILYSIFILIISTISWIISSYYNIKILNIIFLLILCISNIYLLKAIININENNYILLKYTSIISISYLLFHHIFIDLYLLNLNY